MRLTNKVLIVLFYCFCWSHPMAAPQPVPKNRGSLNGGDWFPYVISKIAPLEWWSFESSSEDIKQENYPSNLMYELAQRNTWEFPRFCFSLFRPQPGLYESLHRAVQQYDGPVNWLMHDRCIGVIPGGEAGHYAQFTGYPPMNPKEFGKVLEDAARNPSRADAELVKKAVADVSNFCAYLEHQLGLEQSSPKDFDPHSLTREGLAHSRAEFEDFVEPGSWSTVLSHDPAKYAASSRELSATDRFLRFGIGEPESAAILTELGANWKTFQREGHVPIAPEYPLLSRLDDMTSDAIYQPDEVNRLMAECLRAQQLVKDPQAIRGLDKLVRIARWAEKLELGIYFGGQ
jgi:hypothetical protein